MSGQSVSKVDVTTYRSLVDEIGGLEDELDAIQKEKMAVYARIREEHGKLTAKAMKNAMRVLRMDDSKRAQSLLVDAEAQAILDALEEASCVARVRQDVVRPVEEAAPIALAQESVEALAPATLPVDDQVPHDPETGEILAEEQSGPVKSENLPTVNDEGSASARRSFNPTRAVAEPDEDDDLKDFVFDQAA
jgi:uncharacterized protein (UPF0335 family)